MALKKYMSNFQINKERNRLTANQKPKDNIKLEELMKNSI